MKINKISIIYIFTSLMLTFFFAGCSTGIEGTKTITYSKSERKETALSEEEKFIADIIPAPLKDWQSGKEFLISDDRAALVFEFPGKSSQSLTSLKGKTISFKSIGERPTPGGTVQALIIFSDGITQYSYPTGKILKDALQSITSLDIPMLIDLEIVNQYKKRLESREVWTRSSLWYDENGDKIPGRKFVPVKIQKVKPGDMLFQIHLDITDENGKNARLYMNPLHRGLESRTFASLLSLSDPKTRYPGISPEIWDYICRSRVKNGMTKEECKLSLGNPDEVSTGHDWNQTIDIWNYKNGIFLQFQDGILIKFRI